MIQRDFDFSSTDNSVKLSVVLMADSFFYGIFDDQNRMICHQSYIGLVYSDSQTIDLINSDARLSRNFAKISIIVMSGDNHQIDFQDDQLVQLFPSLELKNIKVEKVIGQSLYNYFGLSPHQENILKNLWPTSDYKYKSIPNLLSAYHLGTSTPLLHIHIEEGIIYTYAQSDGKMLLYNSFVTKSKSDILYFALATCQAANIDPAIDPVVVSGWIEKDSILYKELNGYIADLRILLDESHQLHSHLSDINKAHYYFIHHANIQCAS